MEKRKIILLIIILLVAAFPTITAFAQYTLIEPLPQFGGGGPLTDVTLKQYLSWAFRFMIALAGILAVLMLIYAGILYITSGGNASKAENAKSKITSALLGLVLAIAAYIILYAINPDLTNLDLVFPDVAITAGTASRTVLPWTCEAEADRGYGDYSSQQDCIDNCNWRFCIPPLCTNRCFAIQKVCVYPSGNQIKTGDVNCNNCPRGGRCHDYPYSP